MEILRQKLTSFRERPLSVAQNGWLELALHRLDYRLRKIKHIGIVHSMDDYEKRKLGVFNLINSFQFLFGILIPLVGLFSTRQFSVEVWLIACLPALVSLISLYLNLQHLHEMAILAYFILYPLFTCIVYINGINLGNDLSFVMFGILSVFFLQDIGYMLFAIAFSMLSYFILAVVLKDFRYNLADVNQPLYFTNQLLMIVYIHYGLWLVKRENADYQFHLVNKSRFLHKQNLEIEQKKKEISDKANTLSMQTRELTELNNVKNKLFSIISHDLKLPMYALRNIFRSMQQQNLPAKEVEAIMPEVVNNLNYTINLMENLLEWAKSQMRTGALRMEKIDISQLMEEVILLLRQQADNKQVSIALESEPQVYIMADRDMIALVLRNLISNAIKFTPPETCISVGARREGSLVEVYVKDSGPGINAETMQQINRNNYYSTCGTSGESGTGLGLMLCKEFLGKNGGRLHIESKEGKGSTFSFIMPGEG